MKIRKENFFEIGADQKISKEQLEAFWQTLEGQETGRGNTLFSKFLFYLGALIAISAMTWFMNLGFQWLGSGGVFLISLSYALIFLILGRSCWDKPGLRLPAGLLITMAVCMVPLAIYSLESYYNIWPQKAPGHYPDFYHFFRASWVWMELGTILAGVVALYFFPFPFLTAPIFCAAWFFTMDFALQIAGEDSGWDKRAWFSMGFGALMVILGFGIDRKKLPEYSFSAYFFGTIAFWGGLNILTWERGEGFKFAFFVINVIMMFLSIILKRTIFMVLGAIGLFAYLAYLAGNIFQDSVAFPFVLSFIGLVIIYLGFLYQRNIKWIEKNVLDTLPQGIRNLIDGDS